MSTMSVTVEPPLRALLSLRLDADATPHASQLRTTSAGDLIVTAPVDDDGLVVRAVHGARVTVSWATRSGVTRAPAFVVTTEPDVEGQAGPLWQLRIDGEPDVAQRREYFRGRAAGEMAVTGWTGEVPARILDLSEGGVRCRIKGEPPVPEGATLTVTLALAAEPIVVDAVVVRAHPSLDGRTELGLRFVDLGERDGDVIRRHLFDLQLRERRGWLR